MKRPFAFFVMLLAFFTLAFSTSSAFADAPAPDKDGFINTGSGTRTKSVAIVSVNVYAIRHDMKGPLPGHNKRAVIDADVDKKFSWRMLRDVDNEKIIKALREAFAMNGYADGARIDRFMSAFTKELKEGTGVSISYNSAVKATSVWVPGQGSATIDGIDFMKAVWSIWFGKIDQPALGDQLISKIP